MQPTNPTPNLINTVFGFMQGLCWPHQHALGFMLAPPTRLGFMLASRHLLGWSGWGHWGGGGASLRVLSNRSDAELSAYLARYTNAPIVLAAADPVFQAKSGLRWRFRQSQVGGGNYDIARGIFNSKIYDDYNGGMLEAEAIQDWVLGQKREAPLSQAFGKLFAGNVRIYQYPNISALTTWGTHAKMMHIPAWIHRSSSSLNTTTQ